MTRLSASVAGSSFIEVRSGGGLEPGSYYQVPDLNRRGTDRRQGMASRSGANPPGRLTDELDAACGGCSPFPFRSPPRGASHRLAHTPPSGSGDDARARARSAEGRASPLAGSRWTVAASANARSSRSATPNELGSSPSCRSKLDPFVAPQLRSPFTYEVLRKPDFHVVGTVEMGDLTFADPNRGTRREGPVAERSTRDVGTPIHEVETWMAAHAACPFWSARSTRRAEERTRTSHLIRVKDLAVSDDPLGTMQGSAQPLYVEGRVKIRSRIFEPPAPANGRRGDD